MGCLSLCCLAKLFEELATTSQQPTSDAEPKKQLSAKTIGRRWVYRHCLLLTI